MRIFITLLFVFTTAATFANENSDSKMSALPNLPFQTQLKAEEVADSLRWSTEPFTSDSQAQQTLKARRRTLHALLEPNLDPYHGTDNTPAECRLANLPNDFPHGNLFSFYSSKNFVLGLCTSEAERRKTQYLILLCEKQKIVITIQFLYPPSAPWRLEPVASCPSS